MIIKNLLLCAALCSTVTLSACSDDPAPATNNASPDMAVTPDMPITPTDMDTPVALTADNFFAEVAAARCAKAEGCCTPAEFTANFSGADCEAKAIASYERFFPSAQDVASGKVGFDAAAARRLIDAFSATSCADLNTAEELPPPYVGKLAEGAACASDYECAPSAGREVICNDVCTVFGGLGEPCVGGFACSFDLYCDPAGVCATPQPAGAACESGAACQSSLCGLAEEGKCDAKRALGELCFDERECVSGFCDFDAELCVATAPAGPPFCEDTF